MLEILSPVLVTLADSSGIVGVMQQFAGSVLSLAQGIVLPVGIIGVIVCGVKIMISSDPQSVAATKRWLIFIVIGIIVVMFAPAILDQMKQLAQSGGGNLNWG